jgi:hypothetical protein
MAWEAGNAHSRNPDSGQRSLHVFELHSPSLWGVAQMSMFPTAHPGLHALGSKGAEPGKDASVP